jgi:spore germination protein GerM
MRTLTNVIAASALLLGAACSDSPSSSSVTTPPATTAPVTTVPATTQPATTQPSTTQPVDEPAAVIYLVQNEKLKVAGRHVGTLDETAVMQSLLAGPTAAETATGISTFIPSGTTLRSVAIEGNEAVVDLSTQFESGGGSLSMQLRVAEVVFTLTALPSVDTVRFSIEGEPRATLGGEGIVVDGIGREALQDNVLPPIFLEDPFDGEKLAQPLRFGGMTNAFEATVNYEVVDAAGTMLAKGVTTATCGSGCWGGFSVEVPTFAAGFVPPVTLRVFDYSEADGTTILDLQEIALG